MEQSTNSQHDPVNKLVFELSKLPGIGEKSALRLAYFLLRQDLSYARSLSEAIIHAKTKITLCEECFNFTDVSPCRNCAKAEQDASTICVVEQPSDVGSIENANAHKGSYHVLHGTLSPLDGVGPEDLKIKELLERLRGSDRTPVREIILALNPSVEGEATALYLSRLLKPFDDIKVSKLAYGIPVGGQLQYTDYQTIHRALENRVEMN